MNGNIISDVRGRLRIGFRPQQLGPDSFERLSSGIMKSGEVKFVSFSRLTGSLLVYYDKGDERRKAILDIIQDFDPGPSVPVSCFGAKSLQVGEECPLPFNPIYTKLLTLVLLPRYLRIAWNIIIAVPYVLKGLKHLLWKNKLDVEVLDASALMVCYLRGDFGSAGTLLFFYALSDYLECWTRRRSLACLFHSLKGPEEKVWVKDPETKEMRQVPESELVIGSLVVIQAGGLIPVDGIVEEGVASVNQATMTGEPLPVHMEHGGAVFAGTAVEEGEIVIRATKVGGNTRIRSIIEYIKESEASKSGLQGRAERMADSIVPFNFLLSLGTFLATRNVAKAGNALLVDYSCAIRLSTPVAVLSAMQEGNGSGILVKGGRYLEEIALADTCVFDKTGTLTEAKPQVTEIITFQDGVHESLSRDEALSLAACLEEHFPHPVGRAVVNLAKKEGLHHEVEMHTKVNYVVAHGISSSWKGKKVLLGSHHFVVDDEKVPMTPEAEAASKRITDQGQSMVYLAVEGFLTAIIVISDQLRYHAKETLRALKDKGIKHTVMLTGDLAATAKNIAGKIGFDEFRAQLLPDDKAAAVKEMAESGRRIMMVGDGLNDSAALSLAGVGIALSDGSELAKDVANVQLLNGRIDALPVARLLAERTMRRTRENYWIIVILNSFYLSLGLLGFAGAGLTSFLHNATTIMVAWRASKPFLAPSERLQPKLPEAEPAKSADGPAITDLRQASNP
ncbi:MAG: heavy metal translocating P-type ATPase [Deltaproteobacteria bacterium]|jgi:Cu2+-exporting ATPase|nr:heavy metal translocating P-type ATPase [Deltaproteobacteria bacterium]